MNQNALIIDQALSPLCELIKERARNELNINDALRLRSLAFVHLCVKTILNLSDDSAFDCITDGGQDFGVDAIYWSKESDDELTISIFQGKYSRDFEGTSAFSETSIEKIIQAVRYLFDVYIAIPQVNDRLRIPVEEIRSLIRDGAIPQVRIFACNNGLRWQSPADETIKRASFGDQVTWEHVNHDDLVTMIHAPERVNDTLNLTGTAIIEEFDISRVLIAKITVTEIAELIRRNGDRLLEKNVRKYLGLRGNRVNNAIRDTLLGPDKKNFYFYNNGITVTCEKFTHSYIQSGNHHVKVENLQIINGGQTCLTIYNTLKENPPDNNFQDAHVLIRLYELPSENTDLVKNITLATNRQNPVDLRDLMANDDVQRRLEIGIGQLGYTYRRKRVESSTKSEDITSGVAAEAVLSVWRKKPHQAKFFSREHFGKLYREIFSNDLNGAQVIIATLIYRIPENNRRRISSGYPIFIKYASCFIAMQMGKYLLKDMELDVTRLTHRNFEAAKNLIVNNGDYYFKQGMDDVEDALKNLYGEIDALSYQQLSATFRRGDLIDILNEMRLRERNTGNAAIVAR